MNDDSSGSTVGATAGDTVGATTHADSGVTTHADSGTTTHADSGTSVGATAGATTHVDSGTSAAATTRAASGIRNFTSPGFDSLRYPSWCLSCMLDKIIGTEEVVSVRRKSDIMGSYCKDNRKTIDLYSGSRGEGFQFKSSDVDIMCIDKHILVIDVIDNTEVTDGHQVVLVMRRTGCNPGFVILQLMNRTIDNYIAESVVDYQGSPVVSSILYRDAHIIKGFGQEGHGPCNTFNYHGDVDIADCFECKKWPSEAGEFIKRSRPYGWPQNTLLDKIIRRGCHLVAIGDKDNELSYIQWRLSFSAAEKDLVHSFNHTQFRVYGALKIFLKQYINQIQQVEDLLCSYFLKTVVFYSIESTPASFWKEDLLIPCFWFCLNKLAKHIKDGYLPNYFVPQNNMFRNKVSGTNQQNLLLVFDQVKRIGWSCLYLCKDFRSLQTFVRLPESRFEINMLMGNREQECELDKVTLSMNMYLRITSTDEINYGMSHALTLVRYARSQREEALSAMYLYGIFSSIGKFYFCSSFNFSNKRRYELLRKCELFLLASAKQCLCEKRLDLATFHYQTGQYSKAVRECQCAITRWEPFMLHFSVSAQRCVFNFDMYKQCVCGRGIPVFEKARTAWSEDVKIDFYFKTFYPSDLQYDIEASEPFPLYIPPITYAVFLLFLCHHKLRNIDGCLAALDNLKLLVNDIQHGACGRYQIVRNMLAICLGKVGDTARAVDACLLSQRIQPERNGASKLLEKLLSGNK